MPSSEPTNAASIPALTCPQERAMRTFLWTAGSRGFDDESSDGAVWAP